MKSVFVWLRFWGLLSYLISMLIINSEALAQEKKPKTINGFEPHNSKACNTDLSTAISNLINRPEFARSRWGIEIQTQDGNSLYSLNGDKFFTPASSAKLLTTAAALSKLGASYRLTTPVYSTGNAPTLTSLRVEGKGDPSLSTQELKTIVHQLQALGVKKIEKLIIDDSYFAPPTINPTWEWLDVHSYFATAVNSAILNQNTVTLTLLPRQVGQSVKFSWSDAIAARQWQVINQGMTGKTDIPYNIEIDGDLGKPILQIRGELAVNESADVWDLAIVNPANYFLESLRFHLVQAEIKVGQAIVVHEPYLDELETKLTTIIAPQMVDLLAEINQESNNLYAESVAKMLAKKLNTVTPIEAINQSLNELGISSKEYILVDASGLSRQNLVSPKTLVEVLNLMLNSPNKNVYRQTLATAGVDGTLKYRYKNTAVEKNLFGKTGSLTGVGALSGYIAAANNKTVIFSILLNNSELSSQKIRQAIDQIIVILNHQLEC